MKIIISVLTLVLVVACGTAMKQSHVHGDNCGHEAVKHGNHYDYIVAGKFETFNGDFHGLVDMSDKTNRGVANVEVHEDHMHGPTCGHSSVKHCENSACTSFHYDFSHEGTYHAIHGGHWHNHGTF